MENNGFQKLFCHSAKGFHEYRHKLVGFLKSNFNYFRNSKAKNYQPYVVIYKELISF